MRTEREKDMESKESFRYVPEEIVSNIFPNLPYHSLLRLRCVSKQWRGLIAGTKITMHKVLFSAPLATTYEKASRFKTIDEKARVQNVDNKIFLEHAFRDAKISLLGSWEGLCLIRVYDDLFLWNPFKTPLDREKAIEIRPTIQWARMDLNWDSIEASGLCFDSVHGELKAVIAVPSRDYSFFKPVVIIGLKSKEMVVVSNNCCPPRNCPVKSGPVVNKKLHWFVDSPSTKQQRVLSFDLNSTHKFADLPLPEGKFHVMGLGVLNGCLCMGRRHMNPIDGYRVDVMAMKQYGVEESWTVLFRTIDFGYYGFNDLVPLFYTDKKDEIFIRGQKTIVVYNTKTRTCREICSSDSMYDVVYEETLTIPN